MYLPNSTMISADIVILATGYQQLFPEWLFDREIIKNIDFDENDNPKIDSDYAVSYGGEGNIFVVNGAKHSHGVVDPNLFLSALRAAKIVNRCTNSDFYSIYSVPIFG